MRLFPSLCPTARSSNRLFFLLPSSKLPTSKALGVLLVSIDKTLTSTYFQVQYIEHNVTFASKVIVCRGIETVAGSPHFELKAPMSFRVDQAILPGRFIAGTFLFSTRIEKYISNFYIVQSCIACSWYCGTQVYVVTSAHCHRRVRST